MHEAGGYLFAVALVAMLVVAPSAQAGTVSGIYSDRKGTPLSGHQLHFENVVSGDIYLARTGTDGSFSADLPPGAYDLRAERGLVLHRNVIVDRGAVGLGQVQDGAPLDVRRPFQREGIAPSMVESGAPATAHLHAAGENASAAPSPGAPPSQSSAASPAPAQSASAPSTAASPR